MFAASVALAPAGPALLLANIWARRHGPRLHPRPVRVDVRLPARRGGVRLRHREHTYQIGSALGLAAMTAVATSNCADGGVVAVDVGQGSEPAEVEEQHGGCGHGFAWALVPSKSVGLSSS